MGKKLSARTVKYLLKGLINILMYFSRIVYLAGPDVFAENHLELAKNKKMECQKYGYIGLYPTDNEIPQPKSKTELARLIFEGNVDLIRASNMVIANLNIFRGACDSGTMWEVGYALSIGKVVIAYSKDISTIPELTRNYVVCIQTDSFEECINEVAKMDLGDYKNVRINLSEDIIYDLNPKSNNIQDIDALTSFKVGYLYGKGIMPKVKVLDKRNQIEKYGTKCCGYNVENFDLPYNLMIWFSSNLTEED